MTERRHRPSRSEDGRKSFCAVPRPRALSNDSLHRCLGRLDDASASRPGSLDYLAACEATVRAESWRDRYYLLVCKSIVWVCSFRGYTQYMKRIVAVPGDVVRYNTCNIFVTTRTGQKFGPVSKSQIHARVLAQMRLTP
jgi:hypothetical protein